MVFSGIPFLYYFLPVVLILYTAAPQRLKNTVLLLSSMAFYAWGEQKLVFLFAAVIFIGWIFGILIEKTRRYAFAGFFLLLSVLICLGLLVYFKYADFFISNFNSLFGSSVPLIRVALPIGISFYTFQLLSYEADVYRGDVPAQKNLIDFAAYVSMFPQLIAGPIVRYADVAERLKSRTHTLSGISAGIRRFVLGLGKKVLIANVLGEVSTVFRSSNDLSLLFYWLYAVSYTLQIYFDFSGYSDMAIGLGRLFGFDFAENFNYPYISGSITEFWRRWHISLGSWFRDYVYIPLGGNRKGTGRQLFNIFVVWMLTGLWHGASWNFVLWGVFYAFLLTAEKLGLKGWLDGHKMIGHAYVILASILGFVLFNAADLRQAMNDISCLFAFRRLPVSSAEALYCLRSYGTVILTAVLASTPLPKNIVSAVSKRRWCAHLLDAAEPLAFAAVLLVVTAYLVDGSFNPFLYFRF